MQSYMIDTIVVFHFLLVSAYFLLLFLLRSSVISRGNFNKTIILSTQDRLAVYEMITNWASSY